jgi:hypothetical protein
MILHVSLPARNPAHVARVLAEIMQGRAYPFPGPVPGAFMAVSGDPRGSMIEVYPETTAGAPGLGEAPGRFLSNPAPPDHWPFHLLMATPLEESAILEIGAREGWRARRFGRGVPGQPPLFELVELWVENRLLVELSTPAMAGPYERASQFEFLDQVFGQPAPAARSLQPG